MRWSPWATLSGSAQAVGGAMIAGYPACLRGPPSPGFGDQPVRRGRRRASAQAPGQDAQPLAKRKHGRTGGPARDVMRGGPLTRAAARTGEPDMPAEIRVRIRITGSRRAAHEPRSRHRCIYTAIWDADACLAWRCRDTAPSDRRRQVRGAARVYVYPSRPPVRAAPSVAAPREARHAG